MPRSTASWLGILAHSSSRVLRTFEEVAQVRPEYRAQLVEPSGGHLGEHALAGHRADGIGEVDVEALRDRARVPSDGFVSTTAHLASAEAEPTANPDEVASMLDDAAVIADEAVPGDQESWWGRNAAGDEVLTRVLRAASRPRLAALHDDLRVLRLVSMADQPLAAEVDQGPDRVTVLWKHPEMVDGLGDLPWHRDCGMGGHALNCPSVVVTICLTTGSPEAGELRFLPGSHRASFPFIDGTDVAAPEGTSLPITAGDMTVHYSDVMHASLPPTSDDGPHRISVLVGFAPANREHHLGERHYNDALLVNDDGQVDHLGQRLERERSSSTSERDPGRGDG